MSLNIEQKVDIWKNKLLDLGKRNRLINYRETKRSSLTIKNPGIFDLWKTVVIDEDKLCFPFYIEPIEEINGEGENLELEEVVEDPDEVVTNQNKKELQRTLRNLRNKAKMSIEEQGINTLYLAFGFLEWDEVLHDKQKFVSPLIMVPVSLTVESITTPFVLEMIDDEIVVNPALKYKLESEFGILLPEYDENTSLKAYFDAVSEVIDKKWSLKEEVGLSLFSYLKINMYNDLNTNKDNIISNPIVRAISGDATAIPSVPEGLINYDFDKKLRPADVYQVVDADSSQQDAILCAKNGISFVLQGPPGTGKSQTITNIIAECLADGKKVLFVSEKMAALDVVYKRLSSAKLDDFCLVLHSHKANKKAVLEQLRTSLDLAHKKSEISDEASIALNTLYQDKQKLNAYANELFEVVSPLNMSIYQVNGELASLKNYEDIIFSIPNVRDTSREKFNRYYSVLDAYKNSIGRMTENYDTNPWRGSTVPYVTNELRHDINAKFSLLSNKLIEHNKTIKNMFNTLDLNFDSSYSNIEICRKLLDVAKDSPTIPTNWIYNADVDQLIEETSKYEELSSQYLNLINELNDLYNNINNLHVCTLESTSINSLKDMTDVEDEKSKLLGVVNDNTILSNLSNVVDMDDLDHEINNIKEVTDKIKDVRDSLVSKYNLDVFDLNFQDKLNDYLDSYYTFVTKVNSTYSLNGFEDCLPFALIPSYWLENSISDLKSDVQNWISKRDEYNTCLSNIKQSSGFILTNFAELNDLKSTSLESVKEKILRYIDSRYSLSKMMVNENEEQCENEFVVLTELVEKVNAIKSNLLVEYDPEIFDLDYKEMLKRYKLEYSSVFKFFKGSYREDQKQIKFLLKNPSIKLDDVFIMNTLNKLKEIDDMRLEMSNKCSNIVNTFVTEYNDEKTNLQEISKTLHDYKEISMVLQNIYKMIDITRCFDSNDEELTNKFGVWNNGFYTSWQHILEALQWTENFRIQLKQNKEELSRYKKEYNGYLSDNDILNTIITVEQYKNEKGNCKRSFDKLINIFSDSFDFENTDYNLIHDNIHTMVLLSKAQSILEKMKEVLCVFDKNQEYLKEQYEYYYNGIITSWDTIRSALTWTHRFNEAMKENQPNYEFIENMCTNKQLIQECNLFIQNIGEVLNDVDIEYSWILSLFDSKAQDNFRNMSFDNLATRLNECTDGLFLLEEWIDFINAKKKCEKEGILDYTIEVETKKVPADHIIPVFKKRFYRLWLDSVLPEYPAVLNFRHVNQENTISEFAKLDSLQFDIAKDRIKTKLINDLPILDTFTSGLDEIGILKRELRKQRKIMPIRRLFKQIPNLLMTLKPCLMMSPLSVSLFLEADTYKFDTVIFDEASQVCTENAIGAISRGKQVIIAGDSKQLPPTNFFTSTTSDNDDFDTDEEEDDTYSYESVLDEANLLPEKTLLWHYRSRHENLIAFSNAKIYHNDLITFPSNIENVPDNGVEYFFVKDGFYDRGGKKGNYVEAKEVAKLVFDHFKRFPKRSLGVITFGEVQQQAVELAIRELRLKNQDFESFFNEDKDEAFFVKNLENVQGDERDTIIFSIGYAKDPKGVFRMNFGPLSKVGGERRLNVAITRAKYNVKLVGSIMPTDIDCERISSEGPKLLRSYIDFAINGFSTIQQQNIKNDNSTYSSSFEKTVCDFLNSKGYMLATNVGCSEYKIDIAVKHPQIAGQFVLGIECDGVNYHSARTARERDRLRHDVLTNMGWQLYRVWSTDWIKDPVTEGNRLTEAIENAIDNFKYRNDGETQKQKVRHNFAKIEEKITTEEDKINPYGFKNREYITLNGFSTDKYVYGYYKNCVMDIIKQLYPVHYDEICQKMAPVYGNSKATVKIKREVDDCLSQLKNQVVRKGDYFYPKGYTKVLPRIKDRKIDYIATDELAEVMYTILGKSVGLTAEGLCAECARVYDIHRMTQKVVTATNKALDLLVLQKRIKVVEGKVQRV